MENHEVIHIIQRIREGDADAFRVLVRQYKEMVFALALKMCRNTEDAEEITQDTFVKAFKGIQQFKGKSKFSTWLYQIGYFTAINHIRRKRIETTEIQEFSVAENSQNALDQLELADQKKLIHQALGYLKPDERAVITLFYLEEYSNEEIAQITKMSLANVKVKIHRSRKKLSDIMQTLMKNEVNSIL